MGKISKIISVIVGIGSLGGLTIGVNAIKDANEEQKWQRLCDGTSIVEQCSDNNGNRYSKYVFHEAEAEKTKEIYHPATPAKTHVKHHPAEYGTRTRAVCVKTTINYKGGTCALSRCRDGEYSGSAGRGTCSYHGGVWYGGGPWYTYENESYLIKQAWDETIIDAPAKEAYTETVVIAPAREAYVEKVLAE